MKRFYFIFILIFSFGFDISAQNNSDGGTTEIANYNRRRLTEWYGMYLSPRSHVKEDAGYEFLLNRLLESPNRTEWGVILSSLNEPEFCICFEQNDGTLRLSEADKRIQGIVLNLVRNSLEYMGIDEHGNRSFKINYFNKLKLEDIKEEVLDIKVSTFSMKIDKSLADALYNLFLAATYTVSYVKHTPEPVPHDTYMVYCDRNAGEIHLANRDLMPYTNCCNMIRVIDILRKAVRDNNAEIIKEHLNDIVSLTDSFKRNAPEIP